ncbi:MAG: dihydroneopterin aldolase [Cognatishimia sp.]
MTDPTTLAFAHPEERAIATAVAGVHDRLSLRDHVVSVEIGAFQAERDMTQRLSFDVVVEVSEPEADVQDDVDLILSYDRITWAIEHELAAERLNLLETLAERIADRILMEPQALRVFVRIQKLDKGNGALGVEIMRVPGQGVAADQQALAPAVVFLSNAALVSDNLSGWIDALRDTGAPVVICLDTPDHGIAAADISAQRHIDLLATEQAAWQMVSTAADFTVAGTRTELDWAMKNGKICLWAPSKMVLDATDTPPSTAVDLAQWFAEQWQACKLFVIGKELPKANTIATQIVTLDQTRL